MKKLVSLSLVAVLSLLLIVPGALCSPFEKLISELQVEPTIVGYFDCVNLTPNSTTDENDEVLYIYHNISEEKLNVYGAYLTEKEYQVLSQGVRDDGILH